MFIVKYMKNGADSYKLVAKSKLDNSVKIKIYKLDFIFYTKVFECVFNNDYIDGMIKKSLDIYFKRTNILIKNKKDD